MASFANPFAGNISGKLSKEELVQAIRLDIAGELEAIFVYDAHVQATDDSRAKEILADIRDEEKVHIGELMTLLRILDPKEAELFEEGKKEVFELIGNIGTGSPEGNVPAKETPALTVGSLIDREKEG